MPGQPQNFNPRSREGSDRFRADCVTETLSFQSTLPRGERRYLFVARRIYMFHFNPRSREGSDGISAYNTTKAAAISIHAPARGATTHSIANSFLKQHFNPRSREGSDSTLSKIFFVIAKFQSTLPRGERLPTCTRDIQTTFISIHAPARGATNAAAGVSFSPLFQSTLPRGERPQFYLKFTLCF